MGDTPFIKFYASDFLGGTSGLSPAERGVYITLLCLMYEENGPIERHDGRLSRRCGAPKAAFVRILESLIAEKKIIPEGEYLFNSRARRAIVDRTNRTQNATHAANLKWAAQRENSEQNQREDDATAMPPHMRKVCQPEPEPEVKEETIVSSQKKRRKPEIDLPENWAPSDVNIQHALEKGFTMQEIDHEADSFRNHHHSKQSRFRDWDAAWRTWIANAIKFGRSRRMAGAANSGGYGQGGSIASIVARRRAEGKV